MKSVRCIALTPYYPYGRNKEKIIAERIFEVDEALDEYEKLIRADERVKTIKEVNKRYNGDLGSFGFWLYEQMKEQNNV